MLAWPALVALHASGCNPSRISIGGNDFHSGSAAGNTDLVDAGGVGDAGGRGAASSTGGRTGGGGTSVFAGTGPGGAGNGGAGNGGAGPYCAIPPTLKEAGDCTQRMIGATLSAAHLAEADYANAAREHNFVTPENEMNWDIIEATRDVFDFRNADQIFSFLVQNDMKVKGHRLVWHGQLPQWVNSLNSAEDVNSAMTSHVANVVVHFGEVVAWDVVSEAWTTTSDTGDGSPALRDSVFLRYLGPSYIDQAFTAARIAAPNALLFYDDFSIEGMNDKSNSVYEMVSDMKTRGIPIDGVSMQMHIGTPNDTPSAAEVAENMQRIAGLGLKIMIGAMDVNGCDGYTLEQERALYHDLVAVCVAQPACTAITMGGISDRYSWLNDSAESGCGSQAPRPLLWDDDYAKKPAYTGVMEALTGR